MSELPKPPKVFRRFVGRFPKVGQAWDLLSQAGEDGPLDERTLRLVKFAVAVGGVRESAVHSAVRKAMAAGVTQEELEQVVALAAPTIGLPAAVAAHCWIHDEVDQRD